MCVCVCVRAFAYVFSFRGSEIPPGQVYACDQPGTKSSVDSIVRFWVALERERKKKKEKS